MTNLELAKSLKHGMFASRDTIDEAYEYAYMIARASDSTIDVMTAIQVVVNTIANQMIKNEETANA